MLGRLAGVAVFGLIAAAGVLFALGFIAFAANVAKFEKPALLAPADAIVALTGGPARISDAVKLLNEGRAGRLLITGVHPDTTHETLARFAPGRDSLFDCCVDLGHDALNTVGNAKEARSWARRNGYRTLIVVTSGYHLPRSLNEISREMPEARLIPYPVSSDRLSHSNWWRSPATTKLLLAEYAKYLLSMLELRWRPAMSWDTGITTARARD